MIVLFVQAAEHCLELGNFFTLFSILGALGFPQVTRLSAAWDRVPSRVKQLQAKLELLMNPSMNMKAYRDHIADSAPLLPFLPLHLKDLVFANEAGDTMQAESRLNVNKIALRTRCIATLCSTRPPPAVRPDPAVQAYLRVSTVDSAEWTRQARQRHDASLAAAAGSSRWSEFTPLPPPCGVADPRTL